CGYCVVLGHNNRRCLLLQGVQANVDPNTSHRIQEQERQTFMRGVGVYTNPVTGNTYFRGGGSNARRVVAEEEVLRGSQPPPGTQPSQ
ncbi:hypothetical protein LINGRAHAP2_LOCUS22734, partial [Linum grandiflorum]